MCLPLVLRAARVNLVIVRHVSFGENTVKLRKEFWEKEALWLERETLSALSPAERLIRDLHLKAISEGHFTYDDPETGLKVLTRLRHFLKGRCCGNACRHCVYDLENAPEELKRKRRFNSSFWVDISGSGVESLEDDDDDYDSIFLSIEPKPKNM
ncbi:unnamed protein product [Notodromas monacha]|uniref:Uncharacterized protein n=1 Tax=Notodromas monacha TaxID=399045 RepID=A0A7R9BWT2_9CRUS|nr:unnamed protein product [Notodromas monacha]CAG0922045.1 unnamed protein product [Notodromas monacha]